MGPVLLAILLIVAGAAARVIGPSVGGQAEPSSLVTA